MTSMDKYLRCTEIIDCDTGAILAKAQALTEGLQTDREKAIALFYFVRDEIEHNPYALNNDCEHFKASATLEAGNGGCQHKSVLLAALARAVGVPARIGFVDIYDYLISDTFKELAGGTNLLALHGYAELYIDGKWIHASPAYNLAICQRKRFIPVEFDGINDAKDSQYDQDGRKHVEHAEDHGTFDDFPWDWMRDYGKQFVAKLGLDWNELIESGERIRNSKLHGRG